MPLPARRLALAVLIAAASLAGCAAEGASTSNFELKPQKVGWYAGEEAHFVLTIGASLLNSAPSFTIDRRFAIEEIELEEQGFTFGGDYSTRNPDDVVLRLERGNATAPEFLLTSDAPSLDVRLVLPAELRDSEYVLQLKLFNVGWVESDVFRVDHR